MEKSKPSSSFHMIPPPDRTVYLVSTDFRFVSHVSQQISHFGYLVQHIQNIRNLPDISASPNFVAIIIDIASFEDKANNQDIFTEISAFQHPLSNIIFISNQDDQVVRLKSIRAGGTTFFTQPINIISLIDKLDSLNRKILPPQTSRVLIIEDQHTVASYYQMVLKMSGVDAQIVANPANILDQMREFHPDLLIMNTFLAEVNAADLAKAIRQMDEFVSIPIIFLSSEDDFGKRIEALELGGDDFLVKPIKASYLMAVVRSRIERSKTLRSLMVRDSLTNLLNHTSFRNVFSQEVNRCMRQNSNLALAMLDIDHFKMVNDKYGHAAGDSVLKGLSRLLQQRLRKSDVIGRYGGDEFIALLLDCEAEKAVKAMDEIRVHFSEIDFHFNKSQSFSLTFSCGISTFPKYQSVESLSDSADQALYIAKADQRNKIIVARL